MPESPVIIYTKTDEAPALATRSFLPVVEAFATRAGISVETRDISLAGRILAAFADVLRDDQRVADDLAELGALARMPGANIIKLPNISASVPQMRAAIAELQGQGFALPEYLEAPRSAAEREAKDRYDRVKGSAVNPVLREGNSDRRAPRAVKEYARKHPHSMGEWTADCRTEVAHMKTGDFRSNEKSLTVEAATEARIEHVGEDGTVTLLRASVPLVEGEIIDAAVMRQDALIGFLNEQMERAREAGVLFSLHLKATMMKVSDPIIFGHAVRVYFKDLISKHGALFEELGVDFNNGFGDLAANLDGVPGDRRAEVEADIRACYENGPGLAMVNSDKGITNLHVPSDVIIDASMPAMVRAGGKMWDAEGKTRDTLAVIPDSSYAPVYSETVEFCKKHGAFDPRTMGTAPNVGLMAQKAEEYGSHDKTFEVPSDGRMRVADRNGNTLLEHDVSGGDIWRMCQTKDAAVRDWVNLAVARARATGAPAVFWLDEGRSHDAELIKKVRAYLGGQDTGGLELSIRSPAEATRFTLERLRDGRDTISVTGNVLRDYLTDLFPILEVGTSAKMLSVVPLMQGGGLFETGAGGSAPKHVQQFVEENHLRWDSLGEFLALAASLEHLSDRHGNPEAKVLADSLDEATAQYLEHDRAPSRRAGELDNRGSHFYIALYWARALAAQDAAPELKAVFGGVAEALGAAEDTIVGELNAVQGSPVEIGGYYRPDEAAARAAMRPSPTFNAIVDGL